MVGAQIGDPFAAIALKGVFEALMEYGTVIVCTSNLAPWDLNPHGIAEDLFDEFSASLLRAVEPVELSAERDYRRLSHASQVVCASLTLLQRMAALGACWGVTGQLGAEQLVSCLPYAARDSM